MFSIVVFVKITHKTGPDFDCSPLDNRRTVFPTSILKIHVCESHSYCWPFSLFINSCVPRESLSSETLNRHHSQIVSPCFIPQYLLLSHRFFNYLYLLKILLTAFPELSLLWLRCSTILLKHKVKVS
jgi:hypothetical protein